LLRTRLLLWLRLLPGLWRVAGGWWLVLAGLLLWLRLLPGLWRVAGGWLLRARLLLWLRRWLLRRLKLLCL
jgi:hypothetical protein